MCPRFLDDLGRRDFPPLPGLLERGPSEAPPLAAAVEPLEQRQSTGTDGARGRVAL
jgi:hypothetical protein